MIAGPVRVPGGYVRHRNLEDVSEAIEALRRDEPRLDRAVNNTAADIARLTAARQSDGTPFDFDAVRGFNKGISTAAISNLVDRDLRTHGTSSFWLHPYLNTTLALLPGAMPHWYEPAEVAE